MRRLVAALSVLLLACSSQPSRLTPADELLEADRLRRSGRLLAQAERYDDALSALRQSLALDPGAAAAWLELGRIHMAREEYPAAIDAFERVRGVGGHDGREAVAWLAHCHLATHAPAAAIPLCEALLRQEPRRLSVWAKLLRAHRELGQSEAGGRAAARALAVCPGVPGLLRYRGYFLAQLGRSQEALESYREAASLGDSLAGDEEVLRAVLADVGRWPEALAAWRGKRTSWVVRRPGNRLAGRFRALAARVTDVGRRPDSLAARLALGRSLEAVGWLREAGAAYRQAIALDPRGPEARLGARRAFALDRAITSLRARFEQRYADHKAGRGGPGLGEVLAEMSAALGPFGIRPLEPGREVDQLSLLYRYTEPGARARGQLTPFFRRHGLMLLLFDVFGPVEANLKNLLFWNPECTRQVWGEPVSYELLICERSRIRHYREFLSDSSYGGLTLSPHTFWLDVETYARIAGQLQRAARRVERRSGERLGHAPPPLPRDGIGHSAWLLEQLAFAVCRQAQDEVGEHGDAALELTRWLVDAAEYHELGHIVIQRDYLPSPANLLRGVGLLLRRGVSRPGISAWSERQAQLTAMAHAKHPRVALCRTIGALARNPRTSPHSRGYREIVTSFVARIRASPERYPNIDPGRNVAVQLYRLTEDQIRELAVASY